ANFITFLTAGFTAIVFCCTLPVCTRYLPLKDRFFHGALYAAICAVILVIIFALIAAKGFVASKQYTKKRKKLFLLRVITAVVTVCILAGAAAWEISFISEPVFTDFTREVVNYDDIDDFIELMATPRPVPDYAEKETRRYIEEKMAQTEHTITINGEEYRFEWKNGEVEDVYPSDMSDDGLPIEVLFVEAIEGENIELREMQDFVYGIGYIFYPTVILLAVLVYVLLKRRIERSE
ncbi:MAG: hypothetical protein ACI4SB_00745, partial [Acutalibacteraceae bacterium]